MRCNLLAVKRLIKSISLEERHKVELRRTPFWGFFQPFIDAKVKTKCLKKHDKDVIKIIQTYTPNYTAFEIGKKLLKVRTSDFTLIFGIHEGTIIFC